MWKRLGEALELGRREGQARVDRSRRVYVCPACGTTTTGAKQELAHCPVCLTGWEGEAPAEGQLVRTYHVTSAAGRWVRAEEQFAAEAALLSRAGWRVANQSQAGVDHAMGATFSRITAVYSRAG